MPGFVKASEHCRPRWFSNKQGACAQCVTWFGNLFWTFLSWGFKICYSHMSSSCIWRAMNMSHPLCYPAAVDVTCARCANIQFLVSLDEPVVEMNMKYGSLWSPSLLQRTFDACHLHSLTQCCLSHIYSPHLNFFNLNYSVYSSSLLKHWTAFLPS